MAAGGAERILWQIGKVDYSTIEFKQNWDFSHQPDPKFSPGASSTQNGWSAFHPGTADIASGSRVHPFTVDFALQSPPAGVFHLTIRLLIKAVGIPQYVVEVNGRKGRFLLNPKLSEEIGDPETAWNILFSRQTLSIDLPASEFHSGPNQVVLTCIGGNYEPILGADAKFGGPSGVYYDELELSDDRMSSGCSQITATPTMFYRSSASGLREVVVLRQSTTAAMSKATATITIGGKDYSCDADFNYDFGDAECAVEVPEFYVATPVKLSFTTTSRSKASRNHTDACSQVETISRPADALRHGLHGLSP